MDTAATILVICVLVLSVANTIALALVPFLFWKYCQLLERTRTNEQNIEKVDTTLSEHLSLVFGEKK